MYFRRIKQKFAHTIDGAYFWLIGPSAQKLSAFNQPPKAMAM